MEALGHDNRCALREQCTQVAHGLVRIMAHAIMVPTSPCSPPTNPHLMFFAENVAMTSAQTGATSKFVWLPHCLVGSCSNSTLLSGNLQGSQAVAAIAIHWICRSFLGLDGVWLGTHDGRNRGRTICQACSQYSIHAHECMRNVCIHRKQGAWRGHRWHAHRSHMGSLESWRISS